LNKKRPKHRTNLFFFDSSRAYRHLTIEKSLIISPRNPFKLDTERVNYEIDSDEEIQELLAENIDTKSEENEPPEEDEKLDFIVPDDYFSENEKSDFEQEPLKQLPVHMPGEFLKNLKTFNKGKPYFLTASAISAIQSKINSV